jgi:Domain of unknown function (DUF1996)
VRRRVVGAIAVSGLTLVVLAATSVAAPGGSVCASATNCVRKTAAFPGGPYFALLCGISHRNSDDAIVFPGSPGRSHNHTYVGNRFVDASSTPGSLIGGSTTCESEADTSAYWFPTLYVGTQEVLPVTSIVYYVNRTSGAVAPPPAGLKVVAGSATARSRQPKGVVAWSCGGVGGTPRSSTIPRCHPDELLQLQVNFPNCWNGKSLDSADHKRHMAYASAGRCPASHPVAIPTIALIVLYPPVPTSAVVASGRFGAHADFVNGWDQEALAKLVAGLD